MSHSAGFPSSSPSPAGGPPRGRRVLFLDDDPERAQVFLADNPDAVWVATVEDCLAKLEEPWDEVHLDHDLGGERFVDCGREDCGMEIVRWLSLEMRPHLSATRFYVHSHNPAAADLMVMQMRAAGFRVESRPFGAPPRRPRPDDWSAPARRPTPPWLVGLRKIGQFVAKWGMSPR